MAQPGSRPTADSGPKKATDTAFAGLLEDSAEDLYDHAPCGYLSTLLDGTIVKINQTLLDWLGRSRTDVVGHTRFSDLLTVGGKLYHETHYFPLLRMQGRVGGVALEMITASAVRLPVLVDSVVKVTDTGEPLLIRTTVIDASDRRAYEQELLRARESAEREREQFRHLATALRRSLVPPVLPAVPGMEVSAYYHAASPDEVTGDFYDLVPLAQGRWAFFLGDVCGKGPDAAAVTSLARYTLRAAAVYDEDPAVVLRNLNRVMLQEFHEGDIRYCTVIFGILNPSGNGYDVTLASGGHPPALLHRSDGTATFLATPAGMIIGVIADAVVTTTTAHLSGGDTLLLYTDGLTEARPHKGIGRRLGPKDLLTFVTRQRPTNASDLTSSIAALLGTFGEGIDDDTALLALSVNREYRAASRPKPD